MSNAKDLRRCSHLVTADRCDSALLDERSSRRVENVAALAASTGDHQNLDAFGDVPRHRRGPLAGFVIGMGVHGHHPERGRHEASLHHVPSPFARDQLSAKMQERYGLQRRSVGRTIGVLVLVFCFVGALAFVAVASLRGTVTTARIVSWNVAAPDRVDVTYQVTADSERQTICALRAQDAAHVDVAYATLTIPAGPAAADTSTYSLRTLAPAFTVELLGCAVGSAPVVPPAQFPPGVVPPKQPYSVAATAK